MDDQTIFYIFGGVLIVSAAVVVLLASKGKFPGKLVPLIAVWFVVLGLGAATFAVLNGVDDSSAPEESQEYAIHGEAESAAIRRIRRRTPRRKRRKRRKRSRSGKRGRRGGRRDRRRSRLRRPKVGKRPKALSSSAENCSTCHGATGEGGNGGPDLLTMPLAKTEAGAIEQVTNGGGGMPAFKGTLSEEEIENVAAYVVQEITHGE